MATLDRPTAPEFPAVPRHLSASARSERRIWPPSYEGAPVTLRVVAMQQVKRLAGNLQRAWVEQRDLELASSPGSRYVRQWSKSGGEEGDIEF